MGLATLQAMAGGIHDHIGGGFHRYAVDRQWRVPHFEKMLYDQAQLAETYLFATQIRLFWDEQADGFFDSVMDPLVAIRLKKTQYDGAEPAPNSLAVLNLVRLARLTDTS